MKDTNNKEIPSHICAHCKKEYNVLLPKGYCIACLNYLMHDKGYKSDFDKIIEQRSDAIKENLEHSSIQKPLSTPPTTDWALELKKLLFGTGEKEKNETFIALEKFINQSHTDLARTIRDDLMGNLPEELPMPNVTYSDMEVNQRYEIQGFNTCRKHIKSKLQAYFKDRFNV